MALRIWYINDMESSQLVYIDKFQFVSAKKYLALEGPIVFEAVHDRMYPLIKYGQKIRVEKVQNELKKGDLIVAWSEDEEMLYFGIFFGTKPDGHLNLFFTKDKIIKTFPEKYLFGEITNIKLPLWEKIKISLFERG